MATILDSTLHLNTHNLSPRTFYPLQRRCPTSPTPARTYLLACIFPLPRATPPFDRTRNEVLHCPASRRSLPTPGSSATTSRQCHTTAFADTRRYALPLCPLLPLADRRCGASRRSTSTFPYRVTKCSIGFSPVVSVYHPSIGMVHSGNHCLPLAAMRGRLPGISMPLSHNRVALPPVPLWHRLTRTGFLPLCLPVPAARAPLRQVLFRHTSTPRTRTPSPCLTLRGQQRGRTAGSGFR